MNFSRCPRPDRIVEQFQDLGATGALTARRISPAEAKRCNKARIVIQLLRLLRLTLEHFHRCVNIDYRGPTSSFVQSSWVAHPTWTWLVRLSFFAWSRMFSLRGILRWVFFRALQNLLKQHGWRDLGCGMSTVTWNGH